MFLICLNANWADFRLVQLIVTNEVQWRIQFTKWWLALLFRRQDLHIHPFQKIKKNEWTVLIYTVFCSSLPLASVLGVTFKLKGICVALHGMKYEKEVSYLINCKSLSQFYFPFLAFISIDHEGSETRHMGGSKIFSYSHLDECPDFCLWFWKPESIHYSSPDMRVRRLHTCVSRCDLSVYPGTKW